MAVDKCNLRKIIVTSMSFATVVFGFLFFLLGLVSFGLGGSYSIIDTFRMFGDLDLFLDEIMNLVENISGGADVLDSAFAFLAEFAFQIVSIVYFIIILIRVIKAIICYSRVWATKDWDGAGESLGKSAKGMITFIFAYLAVAFFLVGGFELVTLSGGGATFLSWICVYFVGKLVLENVLVEEFAGVKATIVNAAYAAVKIVILILSIVFLFGYPVYAGFIKAGFNALALVIDGDIDFLLKGVLPNLTGVIVLLAFGAVKKSIKNNLDGNEEAAKQNGLMAMIFGLVALTYDVIFAYAVPGAVAWEFSSAFIKIAIIGCFHFGMYFLSLAVDAILGKKAAPVEAAPVEAELAPAEEAPVEEAPVEEVSENN